MSAADNAPDGIDPDLWATMTEDERAGIAGTEYSPGELESIKKLAGANGGSDDDGADDEDEDEDDAGAGAENAGAKPAAAADTGDSADTKSDQQATGDDTAGDNAAGAEHGGDADGGQPQAAPMPVYKAQLPEDFNGRMDAVRVREAEAWSKFDSGDLSREELQAEISKVNAEREELNRLLTKSEVSQEMSEQTAASMWQATIDRSYREFSKPEQGGIDYKKDPAKESDLDHFVKALAASDANATKPMEWFLSEAHKRVLALHGLAPKASKQQAVAEATERRKPDLAAVPANLSQVPGGDGPGDVGGEFADIDALDGEEFEDALAKMSPEKRARYATAR